MLSLQISAQRQHSVECVPRLQIFQTAMGRVCYPDQCILNYLYKDARVLRVPVKISLLFSGLPQKYILPPAKKNQKITPPSSLLPQNISRIVMCSRGKDKHWSGGFFKLLFYSKIILFIQYLKCSLCSRILGEIVGYSLCRILGERMNTNTVLELIMKYLRSNSSRSLFPEDIILRIKSAAFATY